MVAAVADPPPFDETLAVWERLTQRAGIRRGMLLLGRDGANRRLPFRLATASVFSGRNGLNATLDLSGPGVTKDGRLSYAAQRCCRVRNLCEIEVLSRDVVAVLHWSEDPLHPLSTRRFEREDGHPKMAADEQERDEDRVGQLAS